MKFQVKQPKRETRNLKPETYNFNIMKKLNLYKLTLLLIVLAMSTSLMADDYYVDPSGTDDGSHGSGPGIGAWETIQYAVNNVSDPTTATIMIHVSGDTYTLNSNPIYTNFRGFGSISGGLTIRGAGAGSTIVQAESSPGTATDCVFYIHGSDETVTLEDMTIRYGHRGIYNQYGTLTLTNCTISGNTIDSGGGAGIENYEGTLTMTNCTVSGNTSNSGFGGGIYNSVDGTLTMTNCTVSGNTSNSLLDTGGGLYNYGTATITNCTFANNTAPNTSYGGAGLYHRMGTIYIKNTIIANNSSDGYADFCKYDEPIALLINNGYNIVETQNFSDFTNGVNGCIVGAGTYNLSTTLANNNTLNGTQTLALSIGSVAINAGNNIANNGVSIPATDQRGITRQGTVDIGAYEYDGTFSATWTGSSSTDWNTSDNWSVSTAPTSYINVTIANVATDPVISPTGTASCNNLTIQSGASLTIQSNASGTGSLIVEGTGTGNIIAERYLSQGKWHYISEPVNDTRIFNTFLALTGGAGHDQFYWWDENGTDNGYTGIWFDILNGTTGVTYSTGSFITSQGYSITYEGAGSNTISFSGVPVTSNQSINITKTSGSTSEGWNLIGNPFSSTIAANSSSDANSFLSTNTSVLNTTYSGIYLWNEQPSYQGNRDDYNTISNLEAAKYIEVGQAFMVCAKNASSTALPFNINMRKHGTATFYKNSDQSEVSRFYMSAENNDGLYNEILIAFKEGMTTGLDISYDAGKLKGNPNIAFYSVLVEDNGSDFIHQALSPLKDEKLEVKIGIDVSKAGNYTFKTKELENFNKTITIKLEDKETGELIDFSETEEYSFNISETGKIRERFVLHFNNASGIDDQIQETENIRFYLYDNKLYIIDKELKNGTIQLFNMLGQPVMEKQYSEAVNTLGLNLAKGYYIVRIITDKMTVSGKIYVE